MHDVDISDENQTLQVPLAWHDHVVDGSFYQLFFSYYFLFSNTSLIPLAISCLVQLSSVRRSLLNTNERLAVLNHMTLGKRKKNFLFVCFRGLSFERMIKEKEIGLFPSNGSSD
jgi:hypothetical protein